jgi:hypothetical protein
MVVGMGETGTIGNTVTLLSAQSDVQTIFDSDVTVRAITTQFCVTFGGLSLGLA